jgi:hypothetical protein
MSADFYARLEQARGSNPSESVVAALARTLRFTPDQRDHLFRLAGVPVPPRYRDIQVEPGLLELAQHLDDTPVCIYNDLGDVLFTNSIDNALFGRRETPRGPEGNLYRLWFSHTEERGLVPDEDWTHLSAAHVNDLRATHSR